MYTTILFFITYVFIYIQQPIYIYTIYKCKRTHNRKDGSISMLGRHCWLYLLGRERKSKTVPSYWMAEKLAIFAFTSTNQA